MPMIPQLQPPPPVANVIPAREVLASKVAVSSINDMIVATNVVLSIQRRWRRNRRLVRTRRKHSEHNEVTLTIDKDCERVIPAFSAANVRCDQVTKRQTVKDASSLQNDKEYDVAGSSAVKDDEPGDTGSRAKSAGDMTASHPSYHPWTDQDLVFLEEGRCIGELHESVRRGNFMDRDELVWKRPQHVIQQLETRRVSTFQKHRRKRTHSRKVQDQLVLPLNRKVDASGSSVNDVRETILPVQEFVHVVPPSDHAQAASAPENSTKPTREMMIPRKSKLPRVHLLKHRAARVSVRVRRVQGVGQENRNANCPAREEETPCERITDGRQIDEVRSNRSEEQTGSLSDDTGGVEEPNNSTLEQVSSSEADTSTNVLDRFVVFSDCEQTSDEVDAKLSRNDLIHVGDLALARSLLYDERHCHAVNNVVEYHDGFIPLTLSTPSMLSACLPSEEPLDKQASRRDRTLIATPCDSVRYLEEDASDDDADSCVDNNAENAVAAPLKYDASIRQEPEDLDRREYLWSWEELLLQANGCRTRSDGSASSTSSLSSGNNASSHSCAVADAPMPPQCSRPAADPVRVLNVMRSAVAETMTRIHSDYRGPPPEQGTTSNQLPDTAPIIPVAHPSRLRLDEAKRLEFLRVLGDFKRCLRPPLASSRWEAANGGGRDTLVPAKETTWTGHL
ncbi:hypothetical protein PHYPSEUDO_011707 [Phytophthora pseudosyringae]|uniref:Uncharacterized protein n=1 Tax=Phytophthora pseudosyringae TaxID=221518 RepID=A0A8T1W9W6_9STRA|nr:hypothetical protein PHYPSEUDO_011707 [Phytophthora pseudosyringae]